MPVQNKAARAALYGLIGGVAGCVAMDLVSAAWSVGRRGGLPPRDSDLVQQGGRPDVEQAKEGAAPVDEVATIKTAKLAAAAVGQVPLPQKTAKKAGVLVHYVFGGAAGATYGLASEYLPLLRLGAGVPFGLAIWGIAVQLALPRLGLSRPPSEYSAAGHGFSLAAHAAFGLSLEAARRTLVKKGYA